MELAFPTPTQSVLEIGPLTIHYYALCIITGIAVAIWLGNKRFNFKTAQGQSVVSEVAFVAVPSGIIGGRIYHVISSPNAYFGKGGEPVDALKIWEGGLGIWGAISIGLLGAYLRYKSLGKKVELPSFAVFADALAPGILFAQAIGRFGNWFNGELFGRPLDSWWAVEIPSRYRPSGYSQFESFHPTFLYEAIWCTVIAILIIVLGDKLKAGQSFALYVAAYCVGRFFIEWIRIDTANTIAGLRVNVWVSVLVGAGAALYFARASKRNH
ncbi:MAG: prolipoprotein diacylglyceryl transferase [Actinobacteria bacterium BACL15 MAG-120619-bin91]|uniref:Phosphatidylglycerol--prolipoprotein diacylglyceryl transferase n=2 Tax=ac1 cluster TaxID=1655545 RepID=A0A0R2PHM1_9ACTN|nr:MAG: prolipoprotein diacylglyceryl transferase [Actinobacteria bacterium BACL15 MAG-120823-bin78]KRO36453.1 MAG: prolipoprotein diacylglyceryl transferase [Actinobacteria bacterium BACL15 MAG-120619-bin91]